MPHYRLTDKEMHEETLKSSINALQSNIIMDNNLTKTTQKSENNHFSFFHKQKLEKEKSSFTYEYTVHTVISTRTGPYDDSMVDQ